MLHDLYGVAMKLSAPRFTWVTIFVLAASAAAILFTPLSPFLKGLASIPGIGALLALVMKVWTDHLSHLRTLESQARERAFVVGMASHMSDVVFDKHVEFAESYVSKLKEGLEELGSEGPDRNALRIAGNLQRVRVTFAAWLTSELEAKLTPIEKALCEIGASSHYLETLPVGTERKRVVDQLFEKYGLVLDVKSASSEEEEDIPGAKVLDLVRRLLGIEELTALRRSALDAAIEVAGIGKRTG